MTPENIMKLDTLRKEHRELDDCEKQICEYAAKRPGSNTVQALSFYSSYQGGSVKLNESMLPITWEDFINLYVIKIRARKEQIIKEIEAL